MPIPLEDTYTDILGKAMRGLKLDDVTVAQRAGVGVPELQTLRGGGFSSAVAAKVAPVLGLNGGALSALADKRYVPADVTLDGLARPVAVVGDSIFAGSMGGGNVSYGDAVKNNVDQILTLPATTVICPGHGPLTSVGEELKGNPFFAK